MDSTLAPNYPNYAPRRPFAWVTWTLVATTVGVFVLQLIELRRYHEDVVGNAIAFSAQALQDGRYYTVLTYAWAHAVAMFGDSNYFWLHIVAQHDPPRLPSAPRSRISWATGVFLGLYLGGAIASVIIWFYFNSDAQEPIIGASGAVFAVIAGHRRGRTPRARHCPPLLRCAAAHEHERRRARRLRHRGRADHLPVHTRPRSLFDARRRPLGPPRRRGLRRPSTPG